MKWHLEKRGHVDVVVWPDGSCQPAQRTEVEAVKRLQQLETALADLLAMIAADQLIPESVSYMRQARAAIAGVKAR